MRASRSALSSARPVDGRGQGDPVQARLRHRLDLSSWTTKRQSDGGAIPSPVDLEIAQGLLDSTNQFVPTEWSFRLGDQQAADLGARRPIQIDDRQSSYASQPSAFGASRGPESRLTSTTWTTVSNRDATGPSLSSSSRSSSAAYEFNRLAQSHGLPELSHYQAEAESGSRSAEPNSQSEGSLLSKLPSRVWLFRKLIRKTPSARPIVPTSRHSVPRKSSSVDIGGAVSGTGSLQARSLDDIARLGGISILSLPTDFSPCALAVPTCLAATGSYIAHNWRRTTGIFRIPGSHTTVNALMKHYLSQIDHPDKESDRVQETVSSALLPTHIPYDVDNVASAFKKFLSGLPGGILGSWWLFGVLRDISAHNFAADGGADARAVDARARLIALGIASLDGSLRISIICAVFGLLNMIGSEAEAEISWKNGRRESQPTDKMGYQALGVVFGPLLIGNMIDQIQVETPQVPGSPRSAVKQNPRRSSRMKTAPARRPDELTLQLARTNITVQVTGMLITDWIGVVRELRRIGLPGLEQRANLSESFGVALEYSNKVSEVEGYLARARSYDIMPGSVRVPQFTASPISVRHGSSAFVTVRRTQDGSHARMEPRMIRIRGKSSHHVLNRYASDSFLRPGMRESLKKRAVSSPKAFELSTLGKLDGPPPTARTSLDSHLPVANSAVQRSRELSGHGVAPRISGVVVGLLDSPSQKTPRSISSMQRSPIARPKQHYERQTNARTPQSFTSQREGGGIDPILEAEAAVEGAPEATRVLEVKARPSKNMAGFARRSMELDDSTIHVMATPTRSARARVSPASQNPDMHRAWPWHSPKADQMASPTRNGDDVAARDVGQGISAVRTAVESPRSKLIVSPENSADLPRLPSYKIPHRRSSLFNELDMQDRTRHSHDRSSGLDHALTNSDNSLRTPEDLALACDIAFAAAKNLNSTKPQLNIMSPVEHDASRMQKRIASSTIDGDVRLYSAAGGPSKGNATLYAEIQRLQRQLDAKTEEAKQAQRELEAMRNFRDSKALSEQLRDTQKELATWKERAEWAERRVFTRDWEVKKPAPGTCMRP